MIVFANGNGNILKTIPLEVYQGSNKASTIYFIAPFDSDIVNIAFTLPNGKTRPQRIMTRLTDFMAIPELKDVNGKEIGVWGYSLPQSITAYYGQVSAQIFVTNTNEEIISTSEFSFNVLKGVAHIEPPKDTDSYQQLLSLISNIIHALGNKYEKVEGIDLIQEAGGVLIRVHGDDGSTNIRPGSFNVIDNAYNMLAITPESFNATRSNGDIIQLNFPNASGIIATREWVNKQGFGSGGSGGTSIDVQINGTSIVENGVANIPLATYDNAGVSKVNNGLGIATYNGFLRTWAAEPSEIDNRTDSGTGISSVTLNNCRPIVPGNLDYAVKQAIIDNKTGTLTDDEQEVACEWLGAAPRYPQLSGNLRVWTSSQKGSGYWDVVQSNDASGTNGHIPKYQNDTGGLVERNGYLICHTPKNPYHTANKKYVDDTVAGINFDSMKKQIFNAIYPVGAVYISMNPTPPSTLFGGTWEEFGNEQTLWLTSTTNENKIAGDIEEAGLPNITGSVEFASVAEVDLVASEGALTISSGGSRSYTGSSQQSRNGGIINFNAASGDGDTNIYGNSDTVQPPAIRVYAWKRTALAE